MFGGQQVNGFLWDTDLSDRCLCLGAGEGQLSVRIFDILLRSVYKELHADHETGAADNK